MTPDLALVVAIAGLLATGLGALAALKVWQDWLALRREQLLSGGSPSAGGDLAELRRRVRTLEAIASGIE